MSYIEKINIVNYKCFKGKFSLELNNGINIIVGNNEAGKSTIIEAIHIALTGLLNAKYLKNELSPYLFNKEVEQEYLASLNSTSPQNPPFIYIEVFFEGTDFPNLEGDANSEHKKCSGISFKLEFDSEYLSEYSELIKTDVKTIPIEYYKITWSSFAREVITIRSIPIKSVLIDSSASRFQNGSDVYISKIIKDDLDEKEIVDLAQAYRKLKEKFMDDESIKAINTKITDKADITSKKVNISIDLSAKNSWETVLMTYLEDIPFHQIGKGEQCIIKTNLALAHHDSKDSNLILIEEPENHLSHSMLNKFITNIKTKCEGKQIIITTHDNFVANKLSLKNLILLNDKKTTRLSNLDQETFEFFEKLPGYETLRLILSKKVVLVEGPSDELIVQKAYMDANEGLLPIENEIDVISVGFSFKRFLSIAKLINKPVAVVTDNDSDYENNITQKYSDYAEVANIKIFADNRNELHTLEPQLVDANKADLNTLCSLLSIDPNVYTSEDQVSAYMKKNKTACALKIFSSPISINYPAYIANTITWCNE